MKRSQFNKTHLATCLSVALGASMIGQVHAQDANASTEADVEVIQVSGIRSSLTESTSIKRDSRGIVDAISAEDIGKFPDTNLAESLQRITGVSISRNNGEGNQVTIRGFGADYNMVTLNGRVMPAASLNGNQAPTSRAFDFSNLASESVRAIEVYKTGKANIASGGIGGSINIITAKPLDNPGTQASIGVKALNDTTNRVGSDITPEISGMFSFTDESETFGASVSFSQQERDSGAVGAFVSNWTNLPWQESNLGATADGLTMTNQPADGELTGLPSDLRYFNADRSRSRTNAQVTLQYRPSDKLEATLDYTMAKQELENREAELSTWYAFNEDSLTFDDGIVKTPVLYSAVPPSGGEPRDLAFAQSTYRQVHDNDSLGLNLEYRVNDELTLELDVHSASAEGRPDTAYGTGLKIATAAQVDNGHQADFTGAFPIMGVTFNDSHPVWNLNGNGQLDNSDIGSTTFEPYYTMQKTDIDQIRLDGSYEFDDSRIDFGVESRSIESASQSGTSRTFVSGWSVSDPGYFPDGALEFVDYDNLVGQFDLSAAYTTGIVGDAESLAAIALAQYNEPAYPDAPLSLNQTIEEDITAFYVQYSTSGMLGDMPYNFTAGVRQETTDITSISDAAVPQYIEWQSNNDFFPEPGGANVFVSESHSYDNLLPNLDIDVNLTDDLVARASYSITMARADLGSLRAGGNIDSGPTAATLYNPNGFAKASSNNPGLLPLESTNIDLSLEWYYNEGSYVSLGYYDKSIENFIGRATVEGNMFGLRDPSAGPRAQAAKAQLEADGIPFDETNLFAMVISQQEGIDYATLAADVVLTESFDVIPNSEDPLMIFEINRPVNNRSSDIDGLEFAVQHFFGDSGFGFQANYTTVNGDVEYDVTKLRSETQYALVGLSDTANVVGFYEKDGFQFRAAYNWRDKYLESSDVEPIFIEEYSQIDVSASYEVNDNLVVFIEGINLTDEYSRSHVRTERQLARIEQLGARYAIGARYTF